MLLPKLYSHERLIIVIGVVIFIIVGAFQPGVFPHSSTGSPFITVVDPLTSNLPVPKPNNTTSKLPTAKPSPQPLRIAVGGDISYFTDAELTQLKAMGVVEVHAVVPDALPYADVAARIKAHGMVPVYDGEMPFWYNRNSESPFSATELSILKTIYNAGWHNFASEGLYGTQVAQIDAVGFHYYNYGGDQGNNVYTEYFAHAHGSHYANYEEFYDPAVAPRTLTTILYQAKETPATNGILFGLWKYVPSGGTCPAINGATYVKDWNAKGAKITTVLLWGGIGTNPYDWMGPGGCYYTTFNEIKAIRI